MQLETITASYTRKLNHGLYGGGQYESSDHFCSMSATLDDNDIPQNAYQELHQACKEQVEKAVYDEITSFSGGIPADVFYTYLRDLVARRPIDAETYQKCNNTQKAILQAAKKGIQMNKRDEAKENNQ